MSATFAAGRLPTFLVIGAPKAGTTSLHHYLGSHPEVFMPEGKELDFFITECNWPRGTEWYRRQFEAARAAKAVGEASPRYTQHPYYRGVAERAAALVPDARLVYLIRDPLEQMLSHYADRRRYDVEPEPLNRALLENPVYLETARYAFQLEQFLACFPLDQLYVAAAEQLRAPETRRVTLAGILRFIGVEDRWSSDTLEQEHNIAVAPRRWLFQRFAASRWWEPLTEVAPGWLKRPVRPLVHRRPAPRDELTELVERELIARLRDDVERLKELVGPDLAGWPRFG
jgi:hypothetical protein